MCKKDIRLVAEKEGAVEHSVQILDPAMQNISVAKQAGFYKRGCQEKTLLPIPRKVFF
jgi:hypothetical protein